MRTPFLRKNRRPIRNEFFVIFMQDLGKGGEVGLWNFDVITSCCYGGIAFLFFKCFENGVIVPKSIMDFDSPCAALFLVWILNNAVVFVFRI